MTISLEDELEQAIEAAPELLGVPDSASASERLRACARRGYLASLESRHDGQRLATYPPARVSSQTSESCRARLAGARSGGSTWASVIAVRLTQSPNRRPGPGFPLAGNQPPTIAICGQVTPIPEGKLIELVDQLSRKQMRAIGSGLSAPQRRRTPQAAVAPASASIPASVLSLIRRSARAARRASPPLPAAQHLPRARRGVSLDRHEKEVCTMHARASTIQGSPDRVDEGVAAIRSKILPELEHIDGFAGILSMADRTTGMSVTITFWETEDALRASEERANMLRASAASDLGAAEAPRVERFEVLLTEMRQPMPA